MENDFTLRLDADPPLKRERHLRGVRRPNRASRSAQNDPRGSVLAPKTHLIPPRIVRSAPHPGAEP